METQLNKMYSKKHLLNALRAEGLPCTYPTILKYEREHLINKPYGMVVFDDRKWRFYTKGEIDVIIEAAKAYKVRIKPRQIKRNAELAALKAKAEATIDAVLKEVKHY